MFEPLSNFIGATILYAKSMLIPAFKSFAAIVAAVASGEVLALLQPIAATVPFYQEPAYVAGFFGVLTVVLAKVGEWLFHKLKKRDEAAQTDAERAHLTSERIAELEINDRAKVTEALERIFGTERTFLQNQIEVAKAGEMESRLRAHAAINEVQRIQSYLIRVQRECANANLTLPPFQLKTYDELMMVSDEAIAELRRRDTRMEALREEKGKAQ